MLRRACTFQEGKKLGDTLLAAEGGVQSQQWGVKDRGSLDVADTPQNTSENQVGRVGPPHPLPPLKVDWSSVAGGVRAL